MRFLVTLAFASALLACCGHSVAAQFLPGLAPQRRIEGSVTQVISAQKTIIVCSFSRDATCNPVRWTSATRISLGTSNKSVLLALGQYVSVDAQQDSGQAVASRIVVHPDRFVRVVKNLKKSSPARVQKVLAGLRGVSSALVSPSLGEAMIVFRPNVTMVSAIGRDAERHGIYLAFP